MKRFLTLVVVLVQLSSLSHGENPGPPDLATTKLVVNPDLADHGYVSGAVSVGFETKREVEFYPPIAKSSRIRSIPGIGTLGQFGFTEHPTNPVVHVELVSGPSVGTVTMGELSGLGQFAFAYIASATESGTTSFLFKVFGQYGGESVASVVVDNLPIEESWNPPPLLEPIAAQVAYGQPISGSLPRLAEEVLSVSQAAHGIVVWNPGQNTYIYTPASGYSGPDSLFYSAQTASGVQFGAVEFEVSPPALTSAFFRVRNSNESVVLESPVSPQYGPASIDLDTTNATVFATDGDYQVSLEVQDAAGVSVVGTSRIRVDNTAPTCDWMQPVPNGLLRGNVEAVVRASDDLSGVQGVNFIDPVSQLNTPFVRIGKSSQWLYSGYDSRLKEGALVLKALVYDRANNPGHCEVPIKSDNIAPTGSISFDTAPVRFQNDELIRGLINVTASGTDVGGAGVVNSKLFLDNTVIATASAETVSSSVNTVPDGNHVFSAEFLDGAGNKAIVTRPVTFDNAPPVVTITSPRDGAVVNGSLGTISFSVAEAYGIASTQLIVDGKPTSLTARDNQFTLSPPLNINGSHALTVKATDSAGNVSQRTHSIEIYNGVDGGDQTDESEYEVKILGLENGDVLPGNTDATIFIDIDGGNGPVTVVAALDNGSPVRLLPGDGGLFGFPVAVATLSDGSHTIKVTATDSQGNVQSASLVVTVDNTAPTVLVGSPQQTEELAGISTLAANTTDNDGGGIASFELLVDGVLMTSVIGNGANNASVSYVWNTANVVDGNHTIEFRSTDRANNVRSATRQVVVQNGPGNQDAMTISVIAPDDNASVSGGVIAKFDVTNDPTSAGVRVDGGTMLAAQAKGNNRYEVLVNVAPFAEGFHTLTFVALKGNEQVTETRFVYFDKTTPVLSIRKPTDNATLALVQTLSIEAHDSGRVLESVRLLLNGTEEIAFFPGNPDPNNRIYSYQWGTQLLPDGAYTLVAIAKDQSGLERQLNVAFRIDNTNIPISEASVAFRYSNATISMHAGSFLAGPWQKVTAVITNANLDPATVNEGSLRIFVQDGENRIPLSGPVSVSGNNVEFSGTVPDNVRVFVALAVLDVNGKVIRQTGEAISAMSAARGGSVIVGTEGMLRLSVPPNSLTEDALVEVIKIPSNSPELEGAQTSASELAQLEVVYGPFRISSLGKNAQLDRLQIAATLIFQRTAQQMSPIDAGRIDRAERFDPAGRIWRSLDNRSASLTGISETPRSRTITASVINMGVYRIAAIPQPGDGVTELMAYPSPLRAGTENATISYLLGEDQDADVVIYDALGNLVRRFECSSGAKGGQMINDIPWDGRNGEGEIVANGAYIVQVTASGRKARTKIGVAR
jgi:hypothetical protein